MTEPLRYWDRTEVYGTIVVASSDLAAASRLAEKHNEDLRAAYRSAREETVVQLASPPDGWSVFGTHVDQDVELEFWGDDGGVPIWERPRAAAGTDGVEGEVLAARATSLAARVTRDAGQRVTPDEVAAVLVEHTPLFSLFWNGCTCGWRTPPQAAEIAWTAYAHHVAAVLRPEPGASR